MLNNIFFSIFLLLFPVNAFATSYNVFFFAGQSNCAAADGICDGNCTTARCALGQGILDLNGLGQQQTADLNSLVAATASVSVYSLGDARGTIGSSYGYSTDTNGDHYKVCGSEIGFIRGLYASGWRNIVVIKFWGNYSSLEGGVSAWVSPNSKWTAMINAFTSRLSELTAYGAGGNTYTIRGMLWHQGIDDGLLHRSESAYEADLTQIISDIRSTYGANLPFILARSVNSTLVGDPYMGYIRSGQVDVATATSYSDYINLDDLTPYVNTHHISAASHLTLGGRMATAMLTYIGSGEGSSGTVNIGAGGSFSFGSGGIITLGE